MLYRTFAGRARAWRVAQRVVFGAILLSLLLAGLPLATAGAAPVAQEEGPVTDLDGLTGEKARSGLVEPGAGNWHTWVLSSGSQIVPPAPPNRSASLAEIRVLEQLAKQRDAATLDRIAFWNSGAPVYRWSEMAVNEMTAAGLNSMMAGRNLALVHAAISDATIAAWHAKYLYNRQRPSRLNRSLTTAIPVPASPSYPAEHAVTAGAASEVLAYLFPARAGFFRGKATEAGNAFLSAGVNYPSDVEAGLALGREVAALVVERGKADGSDMPWTGTVPGEPGKWTGTNPALPQAAHWKTWVLAAPDEIRPAAPYAYDSAELAAEMDELRAFQRTPRTNTLAFFWEYGAGGTRNYWFWNQVLGSKLFEYGLSNNPPAAARAYALQTIAYHDAVVACWDAKYTYWAIRPFQLDPAFKPLFTTPNHPSYPSAHSCLSGSSAAILGYLFPSAANGFDAVADEAGEARIWAGLHFRSDVDAGVTIGHEVAARVVSVAGGDSRKKDDSVATKTGAQKPASQ